MLRKLSLMTVAVFILSTVMVVFAANSVKPAVEWDYLSGKFKNLTTGMEYSTNGSTGWVAVSNVNMSGTAGTSYWFRYKGDTDSNYYTKVDVPSAGSAPTGLAYSSGKITGVDSSMEYNSISATSASWTKCTGTTITVTLKASAQTYYIRYAATSTKSASDAVSVNVPASSVSDSSGIKKDFINEVFTGFGTNGGGWYYTTVSATYTGEFLYAITGDTMRMYPNSTYYFRKSGDSSGSAVSTPLRPAAPTGLAYDARSQQITIGGATATSVMGLMYCIKSGVTTSDWANITDTTKIPLTNLEQTVYVTYKPTETRFMSNSASVKLWAKSAVDPAFDPVHYLNGKVLGVDGTMEYQIIATDKAEDLADDAWETCTGGEIEAKRIETAQYVFIRLIADTTKMITIEIPLSFPAPNVSLDLVNAVVTGFNADWEYVYRTAASGSWKAIGEALMNDEKTEFVLTTLLKGKEMTLQIAQKPVAGQPENESITAFKIGAAPDKLKLSVSGYSADDSGTGYATVTGIKAGTQFKLDNDDSWSDPVTSAGDVRLPVGYTVATYIFRVAPVQTDSGDGMVYTQGSGETKVKLSAPAKPPTVKVDYKKEQITIKAGQSYSFDGTTWTAVSSAKTFNLTEEGLYGCTVLVRTAATNKKSASDIFTLRVNPRVANPPTGNDVFITKVKGKDTVVMRSGVRQIEYRDGTKWKKGVPKYNANLSVEIRFMADSNYGPSESVMLTAQGVS